MNNAPIGIFDSGLGGLTVARAIIDKLPDENIVYLGDTANTPYGPRSMEEVQSLAIAGLDVLVDRGVKMLVVACNTATAAALPRAREEYWAKAGIPVIGVISAAAREAALTTRNGRVGIIGTVATVNSGAYQQALSFMPDLQVSQQACPRFVEFVEAGITTGEELTKVTEKYLQPLQENGVDTVILGCTHYPLLTGVISRVLGPEVRLVASSEATANDTYSQLIDLGLLHEPRAIDESPEHLFLSSDPTPRFGQLARRFLGPEVQNLESISSLKEKP